jgi:hypothetical protein
VKEEITYTRGKVDREEEEEEQEGKTKFVSYEP